MTTEHFQCLYLLVETLYERVYTPPAGGTTWSKSFMLVLFQIFFTIALSSSLACSRFPAHTAKNCISSIFTVAHYVPTQPLDSVKASAQVCLYLYLTGQDIVSAFNTRVPEVLLHCVRLESIGCTGTMVIHLIPIYIYRLMCPPCVCLLPSVLILSAVLTRANSVALNITVPSLFRGMFIDTRRCGR